MFKKIIACALLVILALCAVSCSDIDTEAPDGMKSATLDGEPFTLYVPEAWADNTASGISSAKYQADKNITVSARYVIKNGRSVEDFLTSTAEDLREKYGDSFSWNEKEDKNVETPLGDKTDAKKNTYKITRGGNTFVCFHIAVEHEGLIVSLYGSCIEDQYETRRDDYKSIASNFKFKAITEDIQKEITDKKTPDGFKIASHEDAEYVLYVPKSWKCDPDNKGGYAYKDLYDENGNKVGSANVSVSATAPTENISTVEGYFEIVERDLKKIVGDGNYHFDEDASTTCQIAGAQGKSFVYTVTVDGETLKLRQTIFSPDHSYVYSITYTANEAVFDAGVADVDAMIEHFRFK